MTNSIRKIGANITILMVAAVISFIGGHMAGYTYGMDKKTIVVHLDLDNNTQLTIDNDSYYPFLPKELSDYIYKLSAELRIDSDLVVAILMKENPEFNPDAEHKNPNGTLDCGMFQLNDRSTYGTFLSSYWDMDIEFNIHNWKHNTFIACHYIQDLTNFLKTQDEIVMAYNCGLGRTMKGTDIPASTYQYLASVKNNYTLIKEMHNGKE